MIHAGSDVQQTFAWYTDDGKGGVTPAAGVQYREIALDGLATGRLDDPTANGGNWQIVPGQRSDIVIQAPLISPATTQTFYLMIPGSRRLTY